MGETHWETLNRMTVTQLSVLNKSFNHVQQGPDIVNLIKQPVT